MTNAYQIHGHRKCSAESARTQSHKASKWKVIRNVWYGITRAAEKKFPSVQWQKESRESIVCVPLACESYTYCRVGYYMQPFPIDLLTFSPCMHTRCPSSAYSLSLSSFAFFLSPCSFVRSFFFHSFLHFIQSDSIIRNLIFHPTYIVAFHSNIPPLSVILFLSPAIVIHNVSFSIRCRYYSQLVEEGAERMEKNRENTAAATATRRYVELLFNSSENNSKVKQ